MCVLHLYISLTIQLAGGGVEAVLKLSETFVKVRLCLWNLFSFYHHTQRQEP